MTENSVVVVFIIFITHLLQSPLLHILKKQYSRLSLFRIPRASLKHFEISVPRHSQICRIEEKLIGLTTFNKYMCNLTLEVRDILKILWKRGEIATEEQFLLFSTIFLPVVRFSCLGRDQIFTSR